MDLPADPILHELLESGAFETILRSGGGLESTTLTAAGIMTRYPGLSPAGAAYLSHQAALAAQSGSNIVQLDVDAPLPYGELPKVPAHGVPGAKPGDIVVLTKVTMPGGGKRGVDIGINASMVYGVSPTKGSLVGDIATTAQLSSKSYEGIENISEADLNDLSEEIIGVFVVV